MFYHLDLLQDRFDSWVVKRGTSLFNLCSSNVAKQVARVCWPFFGSLRLLSRGKTLVLRESRQNCLPHAISTLFMMSFSLCSFTVLILLLADHPSKELLTEYTVPLAHLKPFHQYHLELVQVSIFITYILRNTHQKAMS